MNHRWCELDNGVNLRKQLSKSIVSEYRDFSIYCSEMAKNKSDEEDIWDERAKTCHKLINKLKDVSFKEKLMKECADLFYIHKFFEKLDSKRHLLGFENGVYDLKKGEFREGIPEDYISNTTKINYIEFTEGDEEHIQNIEIFLEQILPNEAVREYVLRLFSSFLTGKTGDEKIHFWTGSGGNGKSKIIELFEMCFGDYACKLPVSIFSKSRAASNACTPELVRTKGKRFASLQEPDAEAPFNVGLMKELTGGDTIQARGLHRDPIEFKPQFKLILICNDLPVIQKMDGGVERRLRVVEFTSQFVSDPNPDNPKEYLMDTELDEKMEQWPEIFMRILIDKYKIYKTQGNKEPPEVLIATKEYKKDCDIFNQFIDDYIVEDPESKVKLGHLYHVFKIWYSKCGSSKRLPQRRDLKKAMNKRFGEYATLWNGIAIRKQIYKNEDEDDRDEDDDIIFFNK
jgi:P4 family phage/plasmid primase-like protien